MRYGFVTKSGDEYEFKGTLSMSIGSGMELDTRYGYDASKRPQSLTRRKRNAARTASLNITIVRTSVVDLFSEIQKYEELAGATGDLFWADNNHGLWCIKDISYSLAIDTTDIISSIQISINLSEGYMEKAKAKQKPVTVRLL